MEPIGLIMYYPKKEEAMDVLAHRIADVHAAAVIRKIKSLRCHNKQKLALLDAIIATVKTRRREFS